VLPTVSLLNSLPSTVVVHYPISQPKVSEFEPGF
jgi:hypothetical protein